MTNAETAIGSEGYERPVWSRDFALLFVSNFLLFFGVEMLSPVLPVYITQHGGNNTQIGMVMGSFTFSAVLIRFFATKGTAYLGQRTFLYAGLLVCALAAGGYYLTTLLVLILLLRVFHGFGFGAATTLYGAMVSNIVPASRLGEGMSYFGLGVAVAVAVGPFLGAVVVGSPEYEPVFLLSSGLILSAMVLTGFTRVGRGNEGSGRRAASRLSFSDFLELKVFIPSLLVFFVGISMAGIFTFIVLFGKEAGIGSIGIFFLINSLAEIMVRPFSGRLFDRRGHFPVVVPGSLAGFAGMLMLSVSTGPVALIVAALLYGVSMGTLYPALEAWALRLVVADRRVAASATFYNLLDIGVGVGSVLLGVLAQAVGFTGMYRYSSLVFVLLLVIYLVYYVKSKKEAA